MERFKNFINRPFAHFFLITLLLFILLRIPLGLIKKSVDYSAGMASFVALLLAGFIAYWLIYSRGHR